MKRYITTTAVMLISMSLLLITGCNEGRSESDKLLKEKTEQMMNEANRQVGMPNITNFQQRKLMKMIYEETDKEGLITYVYIKSDYQGKLMFIGKGIGFGVPFSAQYTNPEKIAASLSQGGFAILPQPDPNGLYMPTSSSATWMLMIDPTTNKPRPVYIEPEIVVSPFPMHKM